MPGKILVAVFDESLGEFYALVFREMGFRVETANSGPKTIDIFNRSDINLVLVEHPLPGFLGGGVEVARQVKHADPFCKVVIITDEITLELTRKALEVRASLLARKAADIPWAVNYFLLKQASSVRTQVH